MQTLPKKGTQWGNCELTNLICGSEKEARASNLALARDILIYQWYNTEMYR